jgi:peptidoglycan hydrolase-like protein with peptidoglycan-binding domain
MAQAQVEEEEEEVVQAQVEEEEEPVQMQEEEEELLQPKKNQNSGGQLKVGGKANAVPSVESRLNNQVGKGNKMDASTRAEMESGFGTDFSRVNIHTGSEAVQLSKELGAQAFTHGNDIYFNYGKYNPGTNEGKHLLAHELTHTIQQTGKISERLQFTIGDGNDLRAARFSGNLALEACLDREQTLQNGSSGAAVTLVQQALVDAGFSLPRFGVDGIFGNETRAALQDFQRSSGLTANGIVNSPTMSALDALFTGGAPALPPVNPVVPGPGTPPAITSETIKSAPDGSPDTRTTVAVGERVRFSATTAGTWTASEGQFIGQNNGSNIVWEAPAVGANPTITLTTPGGTRVVPFSVIAPNAITMTVLRHHAIPAGTAGACMVNDVVINPLNVNFGRTQWLEVPGPATNVAGYFTRFAADTIFHDPTDHYLGVADDNSGLEDHAAWHEVPAPFSFGTFEWVIPNRYKIDGEPDAQGRVFTNTVQSFFMFAGGTMMINKAGANVIRFINNTII